jgi:hypothetical protein
MITGEPALSDQRARWNRLRLLGEGVTRVLNVDGFVLVEEGRAASTFPGLTVNTTTLHTPKHVSWATEGPFVFGGVLPQHRSTVEEQLRLGAVAIGEIGPGIDHHWIDYKLIAEGSRRAGHGDVRPEVARSLRLAAEHDDRDELMELLGGANGGFSVDEFLQLLEAGREWCALAEEACYEALELARSYDVPVILHHTPTTFELALEAAEFLGDRLICAHSNFQVLDADIAVSHARQLRERGAKIDVMTGDIGGARNFLPSEEVTHAMFEEGCVDLISTDYAGGYWDPILVTIERAVASGVLSVECGVRAATGGVAEALQLFAPNRGTLEEGKVADVVVTEPGSLSRVAHVLTSGMGVGLAQGER